MRKLISIISAVMLLLSSVMPVHAQGLWVSHLPEPGTQVGLTAATNSAHLIGLTLDQSNPLLINFLINKGEKILSPDDRFEEYKKVIKYFLAAMTIPDDDQWVNLSPYEKDRIIPDAFGLTEMGRDLLVQDYILKQLTASLIDPDKSLGKKFWDSVYEKAYATYGITDVPVDTFNKVWIMPDEASVFEKDNSVVILKTHLKVMLETDYLATLNNSQSTDAKAPQGDDLTSAQTLAKQVIKEIIIPEIEKEVNEGENFTGLRQIVGAMVLATWYKRTLKASLLGEVYADKAKVKGVDQDPRNNQQIYDQYVSAFKKGVFNLIREDKDRFTDELIPRKYFSGGYKWPKKERNQFVRYYRGSERLPEEYTQAVRDVDAAIADDKVVSVSAWLRETLESAKNMLPRIMRPNVRAESPVLKIQDKKDFMKGYMEWCKSSGVPVKDFERKILKDIFEKVRDELRANGNVNYEGGKTFLENLEAIDFYHNEAFYSLVRKYFVERKLVADGQVKGNIPLNESPELEAMSREYIKEQVIKPMMEKLRNGEISIPGMVFTKYAKIRYLRESFTKETLAQAFAYIAIPLMMHYGGGPELIEASISHIGPLSLNVAEFSFAIVGNMFVFNKMLDGMKGKIEQNNKNNVEKGLNDYVKDITSEKKRALINRYRITFTKIADYLQKNGPMSDSDKVKLSWFRQMIARSLSNNERYLRVGENLLHAMDIAGEGKLRLSMDDIMTVALTEIADDNPAYFKRLLRNLGNTFEPLNRVKIIQNQKFINKTVSDRIGAEYGDAGIGETAWKEAQKMFAPSKVEVLKDVFSKLSANSSEQNKSILISSYFLRIYSRLEQINKGFLGRTLKSGYVVEKVVEAQEMITILRQISTSEAMAVYGLQMSEIEFMVSKLENSMAGTKRSELLKNLPVVQSLLNVVGSMNGSAVILGAPGTGKTEQMAIALEAAGKEKVVFDMREEFLQWYSAQNGIGYGQVKKEYLRSAEIKVAELNWLAANKERIREDLKARIAKAGGRAVLVADEIDLSVKMPMNEVEIESAKIVMNILRALKEEGVPVITIIHANGINTPKFLQGLFDKGLISSPHRSAVIETGYVSKSFEQGLLGSLGWLDNEVADFMALVQGSPAAYVGAFDKLSKGEVFQSSAEEMIASAVERVRSSYKVAKSINETAAENLKKMAEGSLLLEDLSGEQQAGLMDTGLIAKNGRMAPLVKYVILNDDAAADTAESGKKGGIDLNSANLNLQIKRDGAGVPLPVKMQDLENIKIDGLIPEILLIQSVTNLPILGQALAEGGVPSA